MSSNLITESDSRYRHLEKKSVVELFSNINEEDKTVADAVACAIPQIEMVVHAAVKKLKNGGRMFYIGAGTSGRLGIVDASECSPTFGSAVNMVTGVIAGGKTAITEAVEFAEDDANRGWLDLQAYIVSEEDIVIGISASGSTPYVLGALLKCKTNGITTASICCNPNSPIGKQADHPIDVIVGPEFITGSTRMKCGTAQKLVLNMISTTVMVRLGAVSDNKMINMHISNIKLKERAIKMLMKATGINDSKVAEELLAKAGTVKSAIENYRS